MNPLRFFDIVARTQNLTVAARELNVTQSAVSRQIAVLESYLGVELFRRERQGVKLTLAGERYAERIIPAFVDISHATRDIVSDSKDKGTLRVRMYTTFATQWLLPRLSRFERVHPGIQIDIVTGMRDVDFSRDNVDLAIQSGFSDATGADSATLFHDAIDPVCTPTYRDRYLSDNVPEGAARLRLLYARYSHADWGDWLARSEFCLAQRLEDADRASYTISLLAWRAASHGLGIAMGQIAMLVEELARGDLVRPFNKPLWRNTAYILCRSHHAQRNSRRELFCEWLLHEATLTRDAIEAMV